MHAVIVTSDRPRSKRSRWLAPGASGNCCKGWSGGYHAGMQPSGRPFRVLAFALLAPWTLPACDGGEHEGGHEHGGIEVHVGRVPPTPPKKEGIDAAALRERAAKVLGVLPAEFLNPDNELTDAKMNLGRQLYYDERLSMGGDISCNSCHLLDEFGADGQRTSPGHMGQLGSRNSPTVYNSGGHLAQFWDGRAANLEDQAKGPILNPVEMAMPDEQAVVARLSGIPGYVEAFAAVFPGEASLSYDNLAKAIAAFERRLVTPAPFDAWLSGDDTALTPAALAGLQLFLDTDCQSCHNGYNLGGVSYQKLGTEKPWPGLTDVGRFEVSKDERDRFVYKVPTLRNVAKTGPYLHDGSIESLSEMITRMVTHQTKRVGPFSPAELDNMLAFLDALTGEIPKDYIAKPELPEMGEAKPIEVKAESKPAKPAEP
jgi:cytochrome c peroxidase